MEKEYNHNIAKLLAAFNSENEGSYFINDPSKVEQLAYLCRSIGFNEGHGHDTKEKYGQSVTMMDVIGIEIKHFDTITDAAAYLCVNEYSILTALDTKKVYAGFQWKVKEKSFFQKI